MQTPGGHIAVIDSGVGGLSVLRHLVRALPGERFVYFSDAAFCPYGPRSFDEIRDRVLSVVVKIGTRFPLKMLVVACNTATAAAITSLRQHHHMPIVGMEPAVKPAVAATKSGVVGVLATRGTFRGDLFRDTTERFAHDVVVCAEPGDGLVELVERGVTAGPEVERLITQHIAPMVSRGADTLVLGCTHYPFLSQAIEMVFPQLALVDPAPAVARRAADLLGVSDVGKVQLKDAQVCYLTSGEVEKLTFFVSQVFGFEADVKHLPIP